MPHLGSRASAQLSLATAVLVRRRTSSAIWFTARRSIRPCTGIEMFCTKPLPPLRTGLVRAAVDAETLTSTPSPDGVAYQGTQALASLPRYSAMNFFVREFAVSAWRKCRTLYSNLSHSADLNQAGISSVLISISRPSVTSATQTRSEPELSKM